jgi:hypothetical protein
VRFENKAIFFFSPVTLRYRNKVPAPFRHPVDENTKLFSSTLKNALVFYNAGVVHSCKAVGLAPEFCVGN